MIIDSAFFSLVSKCFKASFEFCCFKNKKYPFFGGFSGTAFYKMKTAEKNCEAMLK
jgi:hypothetical protein